MINVLEALLSLRIGGVKRLQMALSAARKDVMGALSAASMESYEQAYPLVLKLHVLHEIEESQHMQMLSSAAEKRKFRKIVGGTNVLLRQIRLFEITSFACCKKVDFSHSR